MNLAQKTSQASTLTESDFSDTVAQDCRVDELRAKMVVQEDPEFTENFLNPDIRCCSNGTQVVFSDGTATSRINIDQPIGHAGRINEAKRFLEMKLIQNLSLRLSAPAVDSILKFYGNPQQSRNTPVGAFLKMFQFSANKKSAQAVAS